MNWVSCDICGDTNVFYCYDTRNWKTAKCLFCNDTNMYFNVCLVCFGSKDHQKNWERFMNVPCITCLRENKLNEILNETIR